jgi:hypothetical protein
MATDHPAASPLPSVSHSAFAQLLRADTDQAVDESPEAAENRRRAAAELASIFELRENGAFQWFMESFIDTPYRNSRNAFRSSSTPVDKLAQLHTRYVALREIKASMLEREIAHRELISPNDPEVAHLREQLELL